ncbi:MAG: hypothetical protein JWO06_51 [Bacteroidota bacterium]|nr:hypothetical protein [Bacteroidota bacterium]
MILKAFFAPLLFLVCFAHSQQVQTVYLPKHTILPGDPPGKITWSRITNKSSKAVTLYPILKDPYASDSATLIRQLLSKVTSTNRDSARLQLMFLVAHYLKSPSRINTLTMFSEASTDDSINARKYALIGSELSIHNWQCQNFTREAIAVLEATQFFSDTDFIINSLKLHTVLEVKHRGDTIMLDMTSSTPVFIVGNPAKACGYASVSDIMNDTSLISESSRYLFNGQPIFAEADISEYQMHFQSVDKDLFVKVPLDNFDARIVLCAGCWMEYRDTLGYIIDTSVLSNRNFIEAAAVQCSHFSKLYKLTGNTAYQDSTLFYLYNGPATLLNLSLAAAKAAYNSGRIRYYGATQSWYPSYDTKLPQLFFNKPASAPGAIWGKDISFPFLVSSFTYNHAISNFQFYSAELLDTAPVVTAQQFNYANSFNRIIPANVPLQLSLLYNPALINFYLGGAMFTTNSVTDSLLIESSIDTCAATKITISAIDFSSDTLKLSANPYTGFYSLSPPPKGGITPLNAQHKIIYTAGSGCIYGNNGVTGLHKSKRIQDEPKSTSSVLWSIYPNPARNILNIFSAVEMEATVRLFDIEGKLVLMQKLEGNNNTINVSNLPAGNYVYWIGNDQFTMMKDKVVIIK